MSAASATPAAGDRELVLARRIAAPRAAVWRCWTEPELIVKWFAPAPWETVSSEIDLRPGGICATTMRSPDGQEYPNLGVYLEVVPDRRLVFTDAYAPGWVPSEKPFVTAIIELDDDAGGGEGGTAYVARVRHWTDEDCARHDKMGFHDGWNAAANQLEAVAKTL